MNPLWRRGITKFFTRKRDNYEKGGDAKGYRGGGCQFFNCLTFQSHLWSVCVCVCMKSKVSFNTSFDNMVPQSFELDMQGSHPSLYIAKKLYQFVYFGSILEVYRKC